jgi:hypothetical protein
LDSTVGNRAAVCEAGVTFEAAVVEDFDVFIDLARRSCGELGSCQPGEARAAGYLRAAWVLASRSRF